MIKKRPPKFEFKTWYGFFFWVFCIWIMFKIGDWLASL
jgi:hypothetical protein